jgi:hypothetical protein
MAVGGGLLLAPLAYRLPMLGHDWYFLFSRDLSGWIGQPGVSHFLPYTRYLFQVFSWMPWRTSFAVVTGITLMTLALAAWQAGGRYGSILLALFNAPVLMLLWVGQPEGLALLGVITGIIPLTMLKPQVAVWSVLQNRRLFSWTVLFGLLVLALWPHWPGQVLEIFRNVVTVHEANFGWPVLGWPVAALGIIFLLGAGRDPWLLMAAGCLVSPDLMPYHLAVLAPLIGRTQGWRKLVLWAASWLLYLGVGLGGQARALNLLLPVLGYLFIQSRRNYLENLGRLFELGRSTVRAMREPLATLQVEGE